MGSSYSNPETRLQAKPEHRVRVPSFFMGKYPVTQALWKVLMGNNPSKFQGINRPAEGVSWNQAGEFCDKLSKMTGRCYRLPSEAEWEYACRAGTTTPFYFGETITTDLANYSAKETTDVGSFPPNAFGLYDMHGNVWEWCADYPHENYEGAPTDGSAWTLGGHSRIVRGGAWDSDMASCGSANRDFYQPSDSNNNFGHSKNLFVGFRVVFSCASVPGSRDFYF